MSNPLSVQETATATSSSMVQELGWEQLAAVPFDYGVSSGGGLATDGTYIYAADFSGDGNDDYIDLNRNLSDESGESLENLGIANGSVRFARYNPATDTWEDLPILNGEGVSGDAFSAGNLVNPLFVAGNKLYYYQFRSGLQIAALYSYDLSTGTSGTWTQEWEKTSTSEDSPLINVNAGVLGLDVNEEPVILHHTGGGDYNFARTDNVSGGGTHTQLTPNWSFAGEHFPRNGDWEYNTTNDRLYHLSGDQLVMWTHDDFAYPGGSFLTSTPNGESPLASQSTLIYSLKNDLGWTNSGTGTSLWGNSVTAVNGDLYLLRGETSTDGWPFNEGRGLINNRNFAKVGANGWLETLPDVPFNIGKGSGTVYLNGYLYVTQGDTLTVADDYGNVGPLNNEGIRSPGLGFARFAITNNPGTTYTVTNTNDDGEGSLRWAITESNNNPGTDTILFNIEDGYYTITPLSALPEITSPVLIDATSQPGYAGTPIIQISGYYLSLYQPDQAVSGLVISAGDSTVRGLIITQFSSYGIQLTDQGNNIIQGNYIGDVEYIYEGFLGNGEGGILIESANNLIGGATTSERNIISGNTGTGVLINSETAINNQVINNYIGLDSSGTSSRPNGVGVGIVNGSDNIIQENVIAGNTNTGVSVLSYGAIANNNQILSNWIGTSSQGYYFLGNGDDGIDLAGAKNTLVQGNYIHYNQSTGVVIRGADATGNQITGNSLFNNAEGMSIQEEAQGNSITGNTINSNNSNGISVDNSQKNTIQGNSIYENYGLGIDLGRDGVTANDEGDSDTGANALQNYPVFTSAEVVAGTATLIGYLDSEANKEYRIEIFANRTQDASGNGEGEDYRTYITVTTDDNGHADFTLSLSAERLYSYITGTATNPDGNTSEFSPSITLKGELPNLVITEATAPTNVGLEQSFTVNWTVKNQGTVTTSWSYWSDGIVYSSDNIWGNGNDYYLNNFWIDSSNSNVPLDPDETYTMTGNVTLPSYIAATSGYLLLKTDQYNYQAETDDTDNDYSIPIVISQPNLIITNVTAPTSASASQSLTLSWTGKNDSSVTTVSSYWYDRVVFSKNNIYGDSDDIYLTEQFISSSNGLPLEPNETYTASSTVTLPVQAVGSGYLLFRTDVYNYQVESNETDNIYAQAIDIAAPNLIITNVTAPTTASASQTITLSWTGKNDSSVTTVSSNWYDRVVFSKNNIYGDSDDIYVTERYISSSNGLPLEPNETYTASSTVTLPGQAVGSGYLLFKTDAYNYQVESNENDNVYTQAIDIAVPNLIITNVTAPTTASASQSLTLSWTGKNDSSVTTGSSYWYDRVVFSKNNIYGDSDDIYLTERYISSSNGLPLEPNETYTASSTVTLPVQAVGSGYLLFRTDVYNYQVESNKNDNVYTQAIDIAAPNLIITNVTAPTTATASQNITLSWTGKNDGSVTTGSSYWYDEVVFSKNNIYGDSDDVTVISYEYISSSYGLPLEPNETYTVSRNVTLPGQAVGSGYLLFKTDAYNYQVESNENDNVYAQAIDITAPNLTITSATAPTTGILGQSISVSWTVLNNGTVPANADWYDSVYLSNDQTWDSGDTRINAFWEAARSPLAANTSYTDTQNITIPSYAGTGAKYLIFVTDQYSYSYYNQQGETDETDNTYAVPITLGAPDLIISGATAPSSGVVNGSLNVSWTVKNQGTTDAPADWYDVIYLSPDNIPGNGNDSYIAEQYISTQTPLVANGTYTINRSINLPNVTPGNYYIFFRADGYNYQGETNENNNYSQAIPITIGAPDLIVSNATAPESGALGGTVSLSWTVQNQGTVEAPADWTDYIYWSSNDTYDGSDTFITSISAAAQTPVAVGGSYSKTENITLPNQINFVGNGYLIIRADGNNAQGETNENNNNRAIPIRIDAPDLIVSNATAPASVTVGATISVTWDVKNQGTVAANADWYDRVVISTDQIFGNSDDTYLTEVWQGSFTPLAAGATYSRTLNVTLPSTATGDRYLLFKTDNYNSQGETNENNNVYSLPINISASDLRVTSTNAPTSAILGETVELTWTVTNNGTGTASQDWYDVVYLSSNQTLDSNDVQVTYEWIATQTPLATGASYTISKNVALPSFNPGNQYLLFIADSSNYQGEINENNNLTAVAITLTAPDLIVSNASVPATGTVGKSIEVSWTVQNQGTSAAPTDWYDRIYLSNDAIFDANADTYVAQELISTQTPLAAGASYSITRNINLPNFATGNRYLIFVADGSGGQGETNETNNTRAVAINLNAPDLIVSEITAPVESLSGQPIEINWTVKNQGAATAEGTWYDYVYLVNTATSATQYVGIFEYSGSLAAGASLNRTQSYGVPLSLTGNYRVVVTTDFYGQVAEGTQNESNNTTTDDRPISLQLAPVPNLQVTGVTAPSTAFSSQETVVQWTVKNVGTGATNAPVWYDRVYLSLDTTYDDTDTYLGQAVNPSYLNPNDSYSNSLTVTLPRGIDGNYYFLVQADVYNYVTEVGNEGDNWGSGGPTDVNLTPPPDLQVTAVNAPNGAFSGQPMNLSWTVTNAGTGRTLETAWYDRVFMSADATLDAGDRNLGTFYHSGALNAGANYTGSATVNLPTGVAGSFFFFVQSDIYNNVYEHVFENNNSGYDTTATNITLTPPPDLEFESLTIPNNARSGSSLSISYRVTNFGATETPNYYWTDTFYLSSDNQLNTATDINLGSVGQYGILYPGDGYDRTANFALPNTLTGTYYVFGVTDSGDQVFELDNVNNVTQSINQVQIVSQPADLVVTDAITPTTGEAGKTIQVQWTVKNQGTGDTIVNSWSDRLVVSNDGVLGDADDLTLASFTRTGLLAPNGTYSRTESVTLPFTLEGNYQLFVVTDSANSVYEGSNEGNNASSAFPLTISRDTPDLQVTSITLPNTVTPGQPLTLNWTVANLGVGRTNSNYWYDRVYLSLDKNVSGDDINLGSVYRSGALEPSASYSATGTFSLPVNLNGSYYVLVQTDRDNNVIEGAFENNNVLASDSSSGGGSGTGSLPITPAPSADLAVTSVDAPEQGIAGQSLSLTWTVVNNDANTGQNWYDAVYLSRDQVFDRNSDIYLGYRNHTGGLNAGDSYTATQSFNIPRGLGGRFYAFVVTDGGNAVYERLGEINNVNYDGFSTEIILPPPADLVVGTITIPVNGTPGQNATISYTVNNQSTNEAIGTWEDTIYLSRDNQWDVNDAFFGRVSQTGPVAGGGSYSKTVTATLPGVATGDYYVIVRSDIRNYIPESNEANNIGASLDDFAVDVEQLILGVADTSNLIRGQSLYYRVDVPAGETLAVTLDGSGAEVFSELYVSYGQIPSPANFDFGAIVPFSTDQRAVIPTTEAGTYYIQAFRKDSSNTPVAFDTKAELIQFSVFDSDYGQGGNVGKRTIEINGAKFDRSVTVSLRDEAGVTGSAIKTLYEDSTKAYATFDLTGLAPGEYDIIVENGQGQEIILADALEVVDGGGANVVTQVDAPISVGRNRGYSFTVSWYNNGINDAPTPLLRVENTVPFGFHPGDTSAGSSYNFFGFDQEEKLPGILLPGQIETVTFFGYSDNQVGDYIVSVNRLYKDETAPFDWDVLRPQLKTSEFTDVEFESIFAQLISQVGNTNGDYLRMLAENAALIPEELGSPNNVGDLLEIEFSQARAAIGTSLTGTILANSLDIDISGRKVIATNTNTGVAVSTITLNDGSFIFDDLAEGTYSFEVQSAQIAEQMPLTVTVNANEALSGLEITINNGASVKGQITDATINNPLLDTFVKLYQGDEVVATVQPDGAGYYTIMGLSPGNYTLEVEAPNRSRTWISNLNLTNQIVTQNVALTPEAKVSGTVVDASGQSLDDVLIIAQLEATLPNSQFFSSSDNGAFTVGVLSAGTYDITIVTPDGSLAPTVVENVIVPASGEINLGTVTLSPPVSPNAISQVDSGVIQSLTIPDWLDLLEFNCAPVIIAEATILGGSEAANLYSQYFNSTSPNGIVSIGAGSSITDSFKNHSVTNKNITTIQSEVFNAIKQQWESITLSCEHEEINLDIPLNSLTFPSQNLLYADGSQPNAQKDAWNFPFWQGAAGVLAGGVGSGGPPPPGALTILDSRAVNGVAKLHIPAGSSSATVTFDLNVTVVDTVDFDPGNTVFTGSVFWQAAILEQNSRAFDVPFTVSFKPDTQTFSFSVNLDDDDCEEESDDEDSIFRPTSVDPNDILGPDGFGEDRWISTGTPLAYTIRFENDPVFAQAPAQVVRITQQLDSDLDFRTFRLGDFGFGSLVIDVPDNRSFYQGRVDLTETLGIFVDVSAGVDVTTGETFWEFTTVDPTTGELPIDALTGFLPPNLTSPEGEGFVNYSVRPKRNLSTETVIDAEAVIVFDTNEPISTPPIFNTLDVDKPSSQVDALPTTTDNPEFTVKWTGTDTGSALATYTIYVSDNGGNYTVWLNNTELTEATYTGTAGHTYSFYSLAVDNTGNTEAAPTTADATIQIGGAVNQPPQISVNTGLTLNEGANSAISNSLLAVTDPDNTSDQLTFTISTIPTNGNLQRNGVTLAVNNTFTQADINSGLLSYIHNGGETTSDGFSFTVADGAGGNINVTSFVITVNPVDDAPTVVNPITDVNVDEDAENTVLDLTNIFTDIDNDPTSIVKSVLSNDNTGLVTVTIVDNQLT
ncbi:MAG: carboxypeptidase regulatory-like domain-containing protein, partial [Microcystis sp. M049S2]|uniref:CARDB domain-containing protein n=1 Tax=Microcystis sp. M049S2 TaxID=2771169 RepID=UPI002586EB46